MGNCLKNGKTWSSKTDDILSNKVSVSREKFARLGGIDEEKIKKEITRCKIDYTLLNDY